MNWFFETKKEVDNETNVKEPNKLVDILNNDNNKEKEVDEEYFWYKIDEK